MTSSEKDPTTQSQSFDPTVDGDVWLDRVEDILSRAEGGEDVSQLLEALPPHLREQARTVLEAQGSLWKPVRTTLPGKPPTTRTAEELGPYLLEKVLGSGGQGAVYLALDRRLNRQVALKIFSTPYLEKGPRWLRFRREAELASQLDHPALCTVYEAGLVGPTAYIAMRYIEGKSLAEVAEQKAPLPAGEEVLEAVRIVETVARALHYAHESGVVHRDVKPGNIALDAKGNPIVLDFGMAFDPSSDRITQPGGQVGTPAFMSPEQLTADSEPDRRTDVWSLGVTLFELVTRRLPFDEPTRFELQAAILEREPPSSRSLNPAVSKDLEVVISVALSKDLGGRYQTALDFAEDLRRVREREPIRARPVGPLRRLTRWTQRNPGLVTACFAGVLLAIAGTLAAAGWAAHEREQLRSDQEAKARRRATRAWTDFTVARADLASKALHALQAAQEWHLRAPQDPDAAEAQHRAALALGEYALASEQWQLAGHAYQQAVGLGVDDAQARALLAGVEQARTAETRRRQEEVASWLARARSGELASQPRALADAVFALVRYPDPETIARLVTELHEVSEALLSAEADVLRQGAPQASDLEQALAARSSTPPGERLARTASETLDQAVQICFQRRSSPEGLGRTIVPMIAAAQRDHVGSGQLDAAWIACEVLGRIGKGDPAARQALAAYLRAEDDPARAVPAGEALVRLGDPDSLALAQWSLERFGFNTTYARQVQRSLRGRVLTSEVASESAEAWVGRGLAEQAQGNWAGAVDAYTRALALEPDDPLIWNKRGQARRASGDLPGAIEDYTQALELDPTYALAFNNRGNALIKQGHPQGALEDYGRALELDPSYATAWSNRGSAFSDLKQFDRALRDFDRALELRPTDAGVRNNRGFARMAKGDNQGAIRDFDRALEFDPSLVLALSNRGSAKRKLGDFDGALRDYDRALRLDPTHTKAWYRRGVARGMRGDREGALQDFEKAISVGPEDALAWYARGNARVVWGDPQGALLDLDQALKLDPSHVWSWHARGNARRALGDLGGALQDYDQALKLDRSQGLIWFNRGMVHRALGQLKEALADFDRALELQPQLHEALANRGLTRGGLGMKAAGVADLRRFLELAPNHELAPAVRQILKRLGQGE